MSPLPFRLPFVGATLILTLVASAADPTEAPAADPLPKGAKLRLGTARMRDANFWNGAALSADGKYLTAPGPKGLTKYDVTTGVPAGSVLPMGVFPGGRAELAADGKHALTLAFNGVSVWDLAANKVAAKIDRQLPFGDGGVSASADMTVVAVGGVKDTKDKDKPVTAVVWDVPNNVKQAEVAVAQNQMANVVLSPDGQFLATWGSHTDPNPPREGLDPATDPNRLIQIWDAATGQELSKVRIDAYAPVVVFSPDGAAVAVGAGGSVRVYDPKTGVEKRRLFGRGDHGSRVAFSPDGKRIATGGNDGAVQLWAADGPATVVECPVGPLAGSLRGLRFTANDRAVAWATVGATALVWEIPSGKLLSPLGGHVAVVQSLAFATGGKELLSVAADGRVLRWDAATGKELGETRLRVAGVYGTTARFPMTPVHLTADGKTATTSGVGLTVYDAATGLHQSTPSAGLTYDTGRHLCADGRTLVVTPAVPYPPKPRPKSLKMTVWDTAAGAKMAEIEIPVGDVSAAAVTPDRSKLVTTFVTRPIGGERAEFFVTTWDLATGKKIGELSEPGGYATVYLTPSPDGKTALVATAAGKLVAVDLATGTEAKVFDTGNRRLSAAPAFGPGGKLVAVPFASIDGTGAGSARVYDTTSAKVVATATGHAGPVTAAAFSADGKTLATGSADTTVLLWDLAAVATPADE